MVTIENLSFAFKKSKPLFNDLNMNLELGNTYGLFGLNGAGKTTLLNQISGMLFPKKGSCKIMGQPSNKRLPETLSELFLLPEQFDLPQMSAKTYTKIHAPFYPRFDLDYLYWALNDLQVDAEKNLTQLSYGQRKKFLIAFALATRVKLLLMDEPTNGLDIPSKSQFRKIMAGTDHSERCVVISTHQVRDLNTLIDRITLLHNGSIIFDQTIEAISEKLSFLKLDNQEKRSRLYSEDILGGEAAICVRKENDENTNIDLELLFNGIISETEAINNAFQHGGSE